MPKTAQKSARPSPPPMSATNQGSGTPGQNAPNTAPAVIPSSLPTSLVNALPTGAEIIKHVQAIEALQEKLQRELNAAAVAGAIPLARAFVVLHRLNERMLSDEKAFKGFKALWKDVKSVIVPNCFEQSGVDSVPLSEGFRVGTSSVTYASIATGKKPEAYVWLRDHDKGDVIQETINASTLSALAREMAEKNEELPEDLFKVVPIANTSVTKT